MIESKLPSVGTTIFTVMSQLANQYGAVNLGQGFPGFQMDTKLADLVGKYMTRGYNQYAPMPGILELRKTLSEKIRKAYGQLYDPDTEITITSGGTQAIYTAITALVHPDDEVVLFAPAYDCYAPAVELNGGKCVWATLEGPEYKVNWDHVRKLVNHRTRLIVVNTPHNPTGAVFSENDLLQLESIVKGTGILVLSDEVYEHIVFDQKKHESVARFPALAKQSFIVYSFGKTFHNTGWKMGYICGPSEMMIEFRKVHQFNVFSSNTPIQFALNEYMQDEDKYLRLPDFFQTKRDLFLEEIKQSRFRFIPSAGTYFQLLGFESISTEKDTEVAITFTKDHRITAIPCSVFYPDHNDYRVLRFCFAKEEAELKMAGEILRKI